MKISKWLILAFFAIGAGFLGFYLWLGQAVHHARQWSTTEATVTSCQVTSRTKLVQGQLGNELVRWDDLEFAFTYSVSGREYVSKRFYLLGHPPAHIVARDFPVGRKFLASYAAASPTMAVVETGPFYHRLPIVAFVCFGLAATGIVYNRRWA
jgi:hypothetical protein